VAKIDLWQWRAAWKRPVASADSQLDDYPFDTAVYRDVLKGQDAPDFLTARAAGNPLTNPDRGHGASSLTAQGFGSTTFRPNPSQKVTAHAAWKDGHWSVVLQRPLAVGADEGTSLASGERCSVAFAVWDGAARDRNGQKLISIWHDLKVE
jgi:DMSO reductase family type II enzyme heme b subunit